MAATGKRARPQQGAKGRKRAGRKARGRPSAEAAEGAREKILDIAEQLFAEHGFDGVSVREVARKVVVDVALAHYYFSTKKGLFDAVFLRRAAVLNEARLKAIEAYQVHSGPGKATVEGLVNAFLDPVLERWAKGGPGWKSYFSIVAQVNNTSKWGGETMARYFDPVVHRLIDALQGILPRSHEVDLYWCYQFLSGALTLTFAETGRIDRLSSGLCRASDYEAVRSRMAPFIAAGVIRLCAPRQR